VRTRFEKGIRSRSKDGANLARSAPVAGSSGPSSEAHARQSPFASESHPERRKLGWESARKRRYDEGRERLVTALRRTRYRSSTWQRPCIARIAEVGRTPSWRLTAEGTLDRKRARFSRSTRRNDLGGPGGDRVGFPTRSLQGRRQGCQRRARFVSTKEDNAFAPPPNRASK
jgi:hypothetical protein